MPYVSTEVTHTCLQNVFIGGEKKAAAMASSIAVALIHCLGMPRL